MSISKTAIWAATGIIGAGVAGGLTYAAVATPAGAAGNLGAAADGVISAAQPAPGTGMGMGWGRHHGMGRRGMLARLEHGQLTLQTKQGDRTVDLQRGTVSSVSPTSISVTSPDKFHADYTIDTSTKVRTRNGLVSPSSIHVGDRVFVVATGGKALRILDRAA
ncbi:MAG TPA: hypothetical protein VKJ07_18670 [Mycobacteriales bacterium]|nr:hypothetical protein [Mycobacteriales bacterium]